MNPLLPPPPKFNYQHEALKFVNSPPITEYSSMIELHRETHTIPPPPVLTSNSLVKPVHYSLKEPFKRITPSSKLFFIQYIPEGSIRPRWLLVRIELE